MRRHWESYYILLLYLKLKIWSKYHDDNFDLSKLNRESANLLKRDCQINAILIIP